MSLGPTTTTTLLLEGLNDPDNVAAWREFQERYVPILHGLARRLGLSSEDAKDVTQDALVRFVSEYRQGRYNRERARLRVWLIAIVKYRIADLRRSQARHRIVAGASVIDGLPTDTELQELWDAEARRVLVERALSQLRTHTKIHARTIRAFERFVIDDESASTVADELGMTEDDVYTAKSRVAEKLREILSELQVVYSDD